MKTVAVIFGGKSTEHDVSIVTAISSVIKPLGLTGNYDVEAVYIAKNGAWYWDKQLKDVELYSSGKIEDFLRSNKPVSLQFDGGLSLVKTTGLTGRKLSKPIDVVFPATHGTYGEDGSLMGLLRMAGVAYVGCDMESSAIAMNKLLTKTVASAAGVPTNKYVGLNKDDFSSNPQDVIKQIDKLGYPVFVKPVHLGSSIGISRVANNSGIQNALEVAFHYDDEVIVEEEVPNLIELTLPILGDSDNPVPALLEQPLTKPGDFFDFDTKYLRQGGKKTGGKAGKRGAQGYSQVPANIPPALYKKAEAVALATYRAVGCSGIARVDLLVNGKSGDVYFNEVNPLPGSLYAHNWRAAGWPLVKLVEKLIELAQDRHSRDTANATTFNTNFLKQF